MFLKGLRALDCSGLCWFVRVLIGIEPADAFNLRQPAMESAVQNTGFAPKMNVQEKLRSDSFSWFNLFLCSLMWMEVKTLKPEVFQACRVALDTNAP